RYIYEDRWGGQMDWDKQWRGTDSIYGESIFTNRAELFGSLPILAGNTLKLQYSASLHDQNSAYGTTIYNARQWIAFAQLLYDRNLNLRHDLLLGLSYRYSWFDDNTAATREFTGNENKPDIILLPGIFMQHNWKISS